MSAPTDNTAPLSVMGGLLAGGRSRRMGQDKAGAPWLGEQRLADAALTSLEAVCDVVVVLGHGNGLDHRPDVTRLPDLRQDAGPLAGLEALLASGRARRYLICPCDMPLVSPTLLSALLDTSGEAVVTRREGGDRSPLPLALDGGLLARLQAFMDQGGRSVYSFLRLLDTAEVELPGDAHNLMNVNTPADLEHARRSAGRGGS